MIKKTTRQVCEPVQQCCGQDGILSEDVLPFVKGLVGGNNGGFDSRSKGEMIEEHFGALLIEGDIDARGYCLF